MQYLIYFLVAIASTTIGAVTGMGGGVIIKPVLDLLGHYDAANISVLSSVTVFSMSVVSVLRMKNSPDRPSVSIAIPLAVGAVVGGSAGSCMLDALIAASGADAVVKRVQNVILAVLIIIVFIYMLRKDTLPTLHKSGLISSAGTGLLLGIFSSFLGIGGGPINVALIIFIFSVNTKAAAAYSLVIIFFSQLTKLLTIAVTTGFSVYHLGLLPGMIIGAIAGGIIGGMIRHGLEEKKVELLFNLTQGLVFVFCAINIIRSF